MSLGALETVRRKTRKKESTPPPKKNRSAPLPNFYAEVRKQANDAVQAGLKQGVRRMEIEFPIQPGRIDVSLGEFLDESRDWVREFVRPFTTKGQKLWVVFPDAKVRVSGRVGLGFGWCGWWGRIFD